MITPREGLAGIIFTLTLNSVFQFPSAYPPLIPKYEVIDDEEMLFSIPGLGHSCMHILVIEDHPIYFEGLQSILRGLDPDLQLESAATAEHALQLCESGRAYDLCLVDLRLPGIDGATFVEALRDRNVTSTDRRDIGRRRRGADQPRTGQRRTGLHSQVDAARETGGRPAASAGRRCRRARQRSRSAGACQPTGEPGGAGQRASRVGITPRQFRVLELMANGLSNGQIAHSMNVSEHTVKSHVRALFQALDARNRTACVHIAVRAGLVSPPSVVRDVS